jgi:phosphinothricin acetyltransferase
MTDLTIRRAVSSDAGDIAAIYNHYVLTSTATFDTQPKSEQDRVDWLRSHGDDYPVFVAEKGGRTVGWASLSPYRDRPAWAPTVEAGVYVAQTERGGGIGTLLLMALVDAAREAGHRVIVAQIVSDNEASLRMTHDAGFERVGTLRGVGEKFGRRLDVAILQFTVDSPAGTDATGD